MTLLKSEIRDEINKNINKQFRTCEKAFPNEFTVGSYEYWAGQH
jgi:hypothetical protein